MSDHGEEEEFEVVFPDLSGTAVSGAPEVRYTPEQRAEHRRVAARQPKVLEDGHAHSSHGPDKDYEGRLPEDDDPELWTRYMYGGAYCEVYEYDDGTLWVTNDEYASPVNYCPVCGYRARRQTLFVKGAPK